MSDKTRQKPSPEKQATNTSGAASTIRVEITEDSLRDTDPDTGQSYSLARGDVITVPRACALRWLSYGWVTDADGTHPSGERIPGARATLQVHDGSIGGQ
jgi:hypothetical protein